MFHGICGHGAVRSTVSTARDQFCRREVLDGIANRFEQRDLLIGDPARMRASHQRPEVRPDVSLADHTIADRLGEITGQQRACADVDKNAGAPHRLVVAFAHICLEGADKVDMGARLQPCAPDHRLRRTGAAGDHVRAACGSLKFGHDYRPDSLVGQGRDNGFGSGGLAPENADGLIRPDGGMSGSHGLRQLARADHQQIFRIVSRKILRRRSRGRRSPPDGDRIAVHCCANGACCAIKQQIGGGNCGKPPLRVARKEGDGFDTDGIAADPGRHQQERSGLRCRLLNGQNLPLGHLRSLTEQGFDGWNEVGKG